MSLKIPLAKSLKDIVQKSDPVKTYKNVTKSDKDFKKLLHNYYKNTNPYK